MSLGNGLVINKWRAICWTIDYPVLRWRPHQWEVNIGSGNGLVPSGMKPLHEQCWASCAMPYGVIRPQWVKHKHFPNPFVVIIMWKSKQKNSTNMLKINIHYRLYMGCNNLTIMRLVSSTWRKFDPDTACVVCIFLSLGFPYLVMLQVFNP